MSSMFVAEKATAPVISAEANQSIPQQRGFWRCPTENWARQVHYHDLPYAPIGSNLRYCPNATFYGVTHFVVNFAAKPCRASGDLWNSVATDFKLV